MGKVVEVLPGTFTQIDITSMGPYANYNPKSV